MIVFAVTSSALGQEHKTQSEGSKMYPLTLSLLVHSSDRALCCYSSCYDKVSMPVGHSFISLFIPQIVDTVWFIFNTPLSLCVFSSCVPHGGGKLGFLNPPVARPACRSAGRAGVYEPHG